MVMYKVSWLQIHSNISNTGCSKLSNIAESVTRKGIKQSFSERCTKPLSHAKQQTNKDIKTNSLLPAYGHDQSGHQQRREQSKHSNKDVHNEVIVAWPFVIMSSRLANWFGLLTPLMRVGLGVSWYGGAEEAGLCFVCLLSFEINNFRKYINHKLLRWEFM